MDTLKQLALCALPTLFLAVLVGTSLLIAWAQ
jgi:hypothetical protein